MDQEKDWEESGVFLCLLSLCVLFAQGQADGLHLAFPGHGDGKGITGGMLLNNLKLFTTRVFSSLSLIGVLIYNSWELAIVAIIVLLGALYPLTTVRRRIKGLMDKTIFSGSAVMTHYNETFNGNRIVTSYNLYQYQLARFRNTLNSVFKLGIKMIQRTGLMSPLMHFVVSLGIALIIWLGSYLIVTKQISAGNFVSFITALIMLYNPIKSIGNNFNSVQLSLMAMERVFGLLEQVPAITSKPNAKPLEKISKSIEYKNVCFEYVPGKPVLKNVSLNVKVGQTIAFVGNSGGGKTTMVNLLPRFYDVTSGSVCIDGVDVRDLELDSLRDKIAIVFQDNFLFAGTIRENILLGKEDATPEEIDRAVKSACLEEFIASLDKGLDTEIGERGVLLSGGPCPDCGADSVPVPHAESALRRNRRRARFRAGSCRRNRPA